MIGSDSAPNSFTFPFVIKACSHLGALLEGKQIHSFILKSGTVRDVFSVNGLIHMYAACGEIDPARLMFDTCDVRDVVSWNSMLSGYANCGLLGAARSLFDEMPERGIVSWNAMINGYTKCDMSLRLFEEMPARNTVSWSAIITAYAQGDQPNKAISLFEDMQRAGVKPNWATIVSVLSACAHLGALEQGKRVHMYVDKSKMKVDSIIGTALIDMYSKCGCVENAFKIFNSLTAKDVFSWTAMIGGLALNGHGDKALALFGQMEIGGVKPNAITFMGVLCACSHRGLVHMGKHYFDSMRSGYGIEPQIEHYGCLIDSFGRAGLLEEALSLVQTMPMKPNAILWGTLLGACWIHKDADIAEIVVQHLVELTPTDGGVYVLLANIYATVGRWGDAKKVRTLMASKGISKTPGKCLIEVDGVVNEFHVGDKTHPRTEEIYLMLDEIASRLKVAGYVPNTAPVLFDIEEEEKEHAVSYHSEKLAIAFGLISTKPGTTIRMVKNLRVCRDCHSAAKLISRVFDREIVLRDRNVFHYFREGVCSCKDYW
ncbi:hypothetical protein H6P81_002325 [Aristolochia fimbriata]|uniref:DYW domain-containing protein n=1 Tax=Aristolochia fimbriata TaxID=158543 RepID=A0AAV7FDJ4_ARIFI|nr:hypothetical protein H6P81_002325 [Aristolochia fimbriata]